MKAVVFGFLLVLSTLPAQASTLQVPTDYATIQEGIFAAETGDTVSVANGVYAGPGNRDLDFLGKAIVVASASGNPDSCVVDCGGSEAEPHRGFWFHSQEDSNSVLRGFGIINGYSTGMGGAILIGQEGNVSSQSPTIINCRLANNTAAVAALDVWGDHGSLSTLDSVVVEQNHCTGISWNIQYPWAAARDEDDRDYQASILNCVVVGNTGHGIRITGLTHYNVEFDIAHCQISDNAGSGIQRSRGIGETNISHCTIDNNQQWGMHLSAPDAGNIITDCDVFSNQSGGIDLDVSPWCEIDDSRVYDNFGPGIHVLYYATLLHVGNCEIFGNNGDGLLLQTSSGLARALAENGSSRSRGVFSNHIHNNLGMGINCEMNLVGLYSIAGNTITNNAETGLSLRGWSPDEGQYEVIANTIAFNGAQGISHAQDLPCQLALNIVAFNQGTAFGLEATNITTLIANNAYGNAEGDWVGSVEELLGQDGNFSANPLFVDAAQSNFTLAENSPCLPGNHPFGFETGLIGSSPQGGGPQDNSCQSVALAPRGWVHIRPRSSVTVQLQLLDEEGSPIADQGTPPLLVAQDGLGHLSPLVLADLNPWTWQSSFTAGDTLGFETLVAFDLDCFDQTPDTLRVNITRSVIIRSVSDVPNDQGRQVRLIWDRDLRDHVAADYPITQYIVWRQLLVNDHSDGVAINDFPDLEAVMLSQSEGSAAPLWLDDQDVLWEPAGPVVPAMMWDVYANVVPTLNDSTTTGNPLAVFQISAHTQTPQVFFVSMPDSGYSVDNLSPAMPLELEVDYAAAGNQLDWLPNSESDLHNYNVYRSQTPAFTPADDLLVAETTNTHWTDSTGSSWLWHYRITARDFSGNESNPASPTTTTGATLNPPPAVVKMGRVHPNPFNPQTTISFEIAGSGPVLLRIFDLSGACVRTLVQGSLGAGRHQRIWDGLDNSGRALSSGLYMARIQADGRQDSAKLLLVR